MKKYDIKIILATQKKMISCPVSNKSVGKNVLNSSVFILGQPKHEIGSKLELNQVSKTSSSCLTLILDLSSHLNLIAALSIASFSDLAATQ